jgi:hypothetical protein
MIRKTLEITPVYNKPTTNLEDLKIQILPNRSIKIEKELRVVNPYGGNKEELLIFGKIVGGWILMEKNYYRYVETGPLCPICFEETEHGPKSAELPCCGNKIHGACFYNQMNSFSCEGGLYRETHATCPFCRANYFDTQPDVYFYTYGTFADSYNGLKDFDSRKWRSHVQKLHHLHTESKQMLEDKDASVEEEERGGWALFVCKTCSKLTIPGKVSCAEELNLDLENNAFECDACQWSRTNTKDHRCFIHGKKFAMFKCDSCCSLATWDCWSNHYCDRCHRNAGGYKNYPCPGGDKCPLGIAHPPNSHGVHGGTGNIGFVLGCFKCFDPSYEENSSYNENAPDPFRQDDLKNDDVIHMFSYAPPPPKEKIAEMKKEYEANRIEIQPEPEVEEDSEDIDLRGFAMFGDEEEQEEEEENVIDDDLRGFHLFDEYNSEPEDIDEHNGELEPVYEQEIENMPELDLQGFDLFYESEPSDSEEQEIDLYEDLKGYHIFAEREDEQIEEEILDLGDFDNENFDANIFGNLFAPPIMFQRSSACSVDSVLSEDTVNLLNFNKGFGCVEVV